MNSQDRVRRHFDRDAARFDAIYDARKPWGQRLMDAYRRVVVERFELIRVLAPQAGPWNVLDVGCGTCRYGIALAQRGATQVVGLDISAEMLALARIEIERRGLAAVFTLVEGDFLAYSAAAPFATVLAMGYFDYLREPLPHLAKMKALCTGHLFASYPKRWEWRVPLRRLRFLLTRGFVRFYGRRELETLVQEAGFAPEQVHLIDLGRDWILVANCLPPRSSATGTSG